MVWRIWQCVLNFVSMTRRHPCVVHSIHSANSNHRCMIFNAIYVKACTIGIITFTTAYFHLKSHTNMCVLWAAFWYFVLAAIFAVFVRMWLKVIGRANCKRLLLLLWWLIVYSFFVFLFSVCGVRQYFAGVIRCLVLLLRRDRFLLPL